MIGDTCVDCLILGSPNSTIQDKVKAPNQQQLNQNIESGGAAPQNRGGARMLDEDDERGSVIDEP